MTAPTTLTPEQQLEQDQRNQRAQGKQQQDPMMAFLANFMQLLMKLMDPNYDPTDGGGDLASGQDSTPESRAAAARPTDKAAIVASTAAAGKWKDYVAAHQGEKVEHISPLGTNNASVTSGFGMREHPISCTCKFHKGVDIAPTDGSTPGADASADGVVLFSGWMKGYGNMVEVGHADGTRTRYAHLKSIDVAAGQEVKQGQEVGIMGQTGDATGPHLHYEQIAANGERVTPTLNGNNKLAKGEHIDLAETMRIFAQHNVTGGQTAVAAAAPPAVAGGPAAGVQKG